MTELRNCKECNKEFLTDRSDKIFCCAKCGKKYRHRRDYLDRMKIKTKKTCKRCGREFMAAGEPDYCSRTCRSVARIERQRAHRAANPGERNDRQCRMEEAVTIQLSADELADLVLKENNNRYAKARWHYNHLTEKEMPYRF